MPCTLPVHPQQATTTNAKGLALGITAELFAAGMGALYTVYPR